MALIGLSGAGKSTVAPLAAARLGFPWIDLDGEIARSSGRSVTELFAEGPATFRALEAEALERALSGRGPGRVLACGGGIGADPKTRALLRGRAFVVWLRVSPARAMARLGEAGVAERPLLSGAAAGDAPGGGASPAAEAAARLEALHRERGPLYEAASDAVIDTDGLTPYEVADRVAALCRPDPTWP